MGHPTMIKLMVRSLTKHLELVLQWRIVQMFHPRGTGIDRLAQGHGKIQRDSGDPTLAETLAIADAFMRRYKNALRELAR